MPGRKYPCTFDELAPAVLCDSVIWLELIHFYVHTAEKSTGAPLKSGPIIEYVRKALGLARDKYGKIPEYCDFFRVCDKEFSDVSGNWLKGAFREVDTSKFDESLLRGEAMVGQAPSIYGSHRREMARGLRMHGSLDSLVRTLVIHMNGAAAGRPGEIATMSTDVIVAPN